MRKSKIQVVMRKCPRCGKRVAGLNRSIWGADGAHRKYSGICKDCITPDELEDIDKQQIAAVRGHCR